MRPLFHQITVFETSSCSLSPEMASTSPKDPQLVYFLPRFHCQARVAELLSSQKLCSHVWQVQIRWMKRIFSLAEVVPGPVELLQRAICLVSSQPDWARPRGEKRCSEMRIHSLSIIKKETNQTSCGGEQVSTRASKPAFKTTAWSAFTGEKQPAGLAIKRDCRQHLKGLRLEI